MTSQSAGPSDDPPTERLEATRSFWESNPVGGGPVGPTQSAYDYFRTFDNVREGIDVEPYAYSNFIHGYESAAGKHVLDYGCGNGYVLSHYARHGAVVSGVDLTETAVELARTRFRLLGLEGTFVRTDGWTLPFEADSFDLVCSMGVLHHVRDPAPIVRELHRVLRPGGQLIVMLYHRHSWRYNVLFRWRRRFGPEPFRGRPLQEIVNMNDGTDNPWGAVYSRAEARRLLSAFERHSFHVNKLGMAEFALFSPRLQRLLGRILPGRLVPRLARSIGWNLYCSASKPR